MADDFDPVNRIELAGAGQSTRAGDAPESLLRRYLLDPRGGRGVGFYLDASARNAVFRDRGDRLTTARNDPTAIRHMAEIARHRGWTTITLRGDTSFRREAWRAARTLGVDVRGYRPTPRDEQDLARQIAARDRHADRDTGAPPPIVRSRARRTPSGAQDRLHLAEQVVRARVPGTVEQDRILAAARERIAQWLDRGATFETVRDARRPTVHRDRSR